MKKLFPILMFLFLGYFTQAQLGQIIGQVRNIKSNIKKDAVYQKGTSFAQVGLGFPNVFFKASDIISAATGFYTTQKKGFISTAAMYEYAIRPNIGVGFIVGYSKGEYKYISTNNPNSYFGFAGTFYNIGVLGNYHVFSDKVFDIYTGGMLVYNGKNVKETNKGNTSVTIPFLGTVNVFSLVTKRPDAPQILYQVSLGARVFPFKTKSIGFFAEGGYGINILKMGVTSKF